MIKAIGGKTTTWKIAATYIGTIVGAGFASGQEVLQFFGFFGYLGLAGVALAAVLFYYFGRIILLRGYEFQAKSHVPVIYYAGGKRLGVIIDGVIIFFLFGALTTMTAGAGAVFREQFGLAPLWGNILMAGAAFLTVLAGFNGVITAISVVVPLLLAVVFGTAISLVVAQGAGLLNPAVLLGTPAVPGWPLSALVYVSYNLIMAVAVLGPLGNEAKDKKDLERGALWGAIGLGLGAAAILVALLATLPESAGYAVPMIFAVGLVSPLLKQAYAIILFAEIYTTAVASLFGFVIRIIPPEKIAATRAVAAAVSLGALAVSQLGFTNLVRTLFSLVGYAGLLMLGGLLYQEWRRTIRLPAPALRPGKVRHEEGKEKDEANAKKEEN